MKAKQFKEITEWQKETFGEATAKSKVIHLLDEVLELKIDLDNNNPDIRLEYADCILLIYGSAYANGMSYKDICNALDEKMKINKSRNWGEPDENGVVNHIVK